MASPADFLRQMPDPADMDVEQLTRWLAAVRAELARLDQEEPEDMDCEAYEDWGDRHEALEDLADELLDLLEDRRA